MQEARRIDHELRHWLGAQYRCGRHLMDLGQLLFVCDPTDIPVTRVTPIPLAFSCEVLSIPAAVAPRSSSEVAMSRRMGVEEELTVVPVSIDMGHGALICRIWMRNQLLVKVGSRDLRQTQQR